MNVNLLLPMFSVIPAPFPVIGYFLFTKSYTVGEGGQAVSLIDHDYMAETMCFIQPETIAFYTLFLTPLCLCIIINLVFFGMVVKVIKNSKTVPNISDNEKILVRKCLICIFKSSISLYCGSKSSTI